MVEVKPEVDLPMLWFSLIPRTPCDEDSLTSATAPDVLSNCVADAANAAGTNEDAQDVQQLQQTANEEVDKREIQPLPEGPPPLHPSASFIYLIILIYYIVYSSNMFNVLILCNSYCYPLLSNVYLIQVDCQLT